MSAHARAHSRGMCVCERARALGCVCACARARVCMRTCTCVRAQGNDTPESGQHGHDPLQPYYADEGGFGPEYDWPFPSMYGAGMNIVVGNPKWPCWRRLGTTSTGSRKQLRHSSHPRTHCRRLMSHSRRTSDDVAAAPKRWWGLRAQCWHKPRLRGWR